jgi:hypothetical protein
MALADPQLLAEAQVPHLPPPAPARPAVVAPPPVFDAKAMVDATRRKVDNPVYGQLPSGTAEGHAALEVARARMRRKRRRNKVLGWVLLIAFAAVVAGVGYALYTMYQDDQDRANAEQGADSPGTTGTGDESPGALSPLGEQAEVIEGLDDLNSGAAASGRAAQQAIDQAQQVVDEAAGESDSPTTAAPPPTAVFVTNPALAERVARVEQCRTEERTVFAALQAYVSTTGAVPDNPDGLVDSGWLEPHPDGWSSRWAFQGRDGAIYVVPVNGGTCDV